MSMFSFMVSLRVNLFLKFLINFVGQIFNHQDFEHKKMMKMLKDSWRLE